MRRLLTSIFLSTYLFACGTANHGPSTWTVRGTDADHMAELQTGAAGLNAALGCKAVTLLTGDCDPSSQDCLTFVPDAKLQRDRDPGTHYEVAGLCSYGMPLSDVGIEITQEAVPYQARLIALHELGHSFGLPHVPDTIMAWDGYQLAEDDKEQWDSLLADLAARIRRAGFSCPQQEAL